MSTALVTGCSSGIGAATALRLAADGFHVVATMRDASRRGSALHAAASARGVALEVRELDVTDTASVTAAFHGLDDLGVLVNNAAIMRFGSVEETDLDEWQRVFETNTFGAVRCLRAALPIMRARGGGLVVNVSSAAGAVPLPGIAAYAASKAALQAASDAVAVEGAPFGVRSVAVITGAVATGMGDRTPPPRTEGPYWPGTKNALAFVARYRDRRSTPDELADAIAAVVADPPASGRAVAGAGSAALLRAHEVLGAEWSAVAGGPTAAFLSRYADASGEGTD